VGEFTCVCIQSHEVFLLGYYEFLQFLNIFILWHSSHHYRIFIIVMANFMIIFGGVHFVPGPVTVLAIIRFHQGESRI